MFATILGPYPRPAGLDDEAALDLALADQLDANLGMLADGRSEPDADPLAARGGAPTPAPPPPPPPAASPRDRSRRVSSGRTRPRGHPPGPPPRVSGRRWPLRRRATWSFARSSPPGRRGGRARRT